MRNNRDCSEEYPDELLNIIDAINDPIRLKILDYLKDIDSARFRDIQKCVEIPKNLLSYHIKRLRRAGLITQRAKEENSKIKFFYSITPLGINVINIVPGLLLPSGKLFHYPGEKVRRMRDIDDVIYMVKDYLKFFLKV